jgi:hypothetical protein
MNEVDKHLALINYDRYFDERTLAVNLACPLSRRRRGNTTRGPGVIAGFALRMPSERGGSVETKAWNAQWGPKKPEEFAHADAEVA